MDGADLSTTAGLAQMQPYRSNHLSPEHAHTKLDGTLAQSYTKGELYKNPLMLGKVEEFFVTLMNCMHEPQGSHRDQRFQQALKPLSGLFDFWLASRLLQSEDCSTFSTELCGVFSQLIQHNTSKAAQLELEMTTTMSELLHQMLTTPDRSSLDSRASEVTAMIHAAKTDDLGEPGDILQARLSLCKRRPARKSLNVGEVWRSIALKEWSTGPDIRLILIQGSVRQKLELDEVGVRMTRFVGQSNTPILFALRPVRKCRPVKVTSEGILRYLAMQALRLNEEALCNKVSEIFNLHRLESATTDEHWEWIIVQALSGIHKVYLVVELDLLGSNTTRTLVQQMLARLRRLALSCKKTSLKIALISSRCLPRRSIVSTDAQVLDLDALHMSNRRKAFLRNMELPAAGRAQDRAVLGF
jgi:hypothetical protein